MDARVRRLSSFSSSLPPSLTPASSPSSFFLLLPPTVAVAAVDDADRGVCRTAVVVVAAVDPMAATLPLPVLLLLDGVRFMSEGETPPPGSGREGGREGGVDYSHVKREKETCIIKQRGREGGKEGLTNLWWRQHFVGSSVGRRKRGKACRGGEGGRPRRRG